MKSLFILRAIILRTMLLGILLTSTTIYASNKPTTFLGPNLTGGFGNTINNTTAYSLLGEVGVKNLRVGGTVAWQLNNTQFLKASAEYLQQNITYSFNSGDTSQWVSQGALGADYLYQFSGYRYEPQVDVAAYLSHAPNKSLGNRSTTTVISGTTTTILNQRHIAGSDGAGVIPTLSVAPWQGGRAGIGLNYDNVRYNQNFSPSQNANGLGGTFTLNQQIAKDVSMGVSAAVRQPFNNYAANVSFNNLQYHGTWALDVDSQYTAGKNTLPSTWNVGLSVSYYMDSYQQNSGHSSLTSHHNDLLAFASTPAVYMPQVLAIAEQKVTRTSKSCGAAPSITGTFADQIVGVGTTTLNSPTQFNGTNLTYTVTSNFTAGSGTVTINSTTGAVSATGNSFGSNVSIAIKATDSCGRAITSNTFTVNFI